MPPMQASKPCRTCGQRGVHREERGLQRRRAQAELEGSLLCLLIAGLHSPLFGERADLRAHSTKRGVAWGCAAGDLLKRVRRAVHVTPAATSSSNGGGSFDSRSGCWRRPLLPLW